MKHISTRRNKSRNKCLSLQMSTVQLWTFLIGHSIVVPTQNAFSPLPRDTCQRTLLIEGRTSPPSTDWFSHIDTWLSFIFRLLFSSTRSRKTWKTNFFVLTHFRGVKSVSNRCREDNNNTLLGAVLLKDLKMLEKTCARG